MSLQGDQVVSKHWDEVYWLSTLICDLQVTRHGMRFPLIRPLTLERLQEWHRDCLPALAACSHCDEVTMISNVIEELDLVEGGSKDQIETLRRCRRALQECYVSLKTWRQGT